MYLADPKLKSRFTRAEIDALLDIIADGKAAPENLLDNTNFVDPVNQRGATAYPAGSSPRYTIDRWRASAPISVTLDPDEGVLIENTHASAGYLFYQFLSPEKTPYAGEWVTLAWEDGGGGMMVSAVKMPESGYVFAAGGGDASVRLYAPEDESPARVAVVVAAAGVASFRNIMLYRGEYTEENLPPYRAKSREEELMACQRYYRRVSGTSAYLCWPAFFSSAAAARVTLTLPVQMESTPTVSTTVGNIRLYDGAGKYLTPSAISDVAMAAAYWVAPLTVKLSTR